jgi:serine phosphatase RsbU (regulator of sigma subunit)
MPGATTVDIAALLHAAESAAPVEAAAEVARCLQETFGAEDVALLLADLSGKSLVRMGESETSETVSIADTPQGTALGRQEIVVEGTRLHAPVSNRGEAIGVLEMRLPEAPDEELQREVAKVAVALGLIVIANRRYTDLFEWGQRSRPLSHAAEIQRRLLPDAYTLETDQATIAGWLQPASEVAGDTFDFSVELDRLHLSITDAMGHEVEAALLATTAVGALRNARRGAEPIEEQARQACCAIDEAIGDGYVTGQLVRVELSSGKAQLVNAGHPAPYRQRGGVVDRPKILADPPLGAFPERRYRVQTLELEPGDRLYFITDGVIERNAEAFDLEEFIERTAAEHPRDAVQLLMHELLDATGEELQDDAAALCVDWHGGGSSRRG